MAGLTFGERLQWMLDNPPDLPSRANEVSGIDLSERCPACGGLVHHEGQGGPGERYCGCDGPLRRCRERVDAADPSGRMTFEELAAPDPTAERAAAAAREVVAGERRGLAMFGRPGTGKTHVAVAACRLAISRRIAASHHNVVELVGRVQETYGRDELRYEETRSSVIAQVAGRDLVVLDDLGKERTTEDVAGIVYELVDAIYRSGARLIVASNLTPDEYAARYDEAVRSRIGGMCDGAIVVVRGRDHRRTG